MLRAASRLILSAILLVLTGLIMAFAHFAPNLFFSFYPAFSRWALGVLSGVSGLLPFPLIEALAVLLVLLLLYTLVRSFVKHTGFLRWLTGVAVLVCALAFSFVALWGANHFAPPVAETLGYDVGQYTKEQLRDATEYFAAQAAAEGAALPDGADGTTQLGDFATLAKNAGAGYALLAQEHDLFTGSTARVKRATLWKPMSMTGTTGIFFCFTAECVVNPDTAAPSLPYTMCHELAHRMSVAAEDDANFCAFLACDASTDPAFRYSGYYSAFVYCYNALHKVDKTMAQAVWSSLDEGLRADCRAASAHYAKYEGKVQDVAQSINDVYLKTFAEESGVQSYGEVADQLIAWYLEKGVKSEN